MNTGYPESTESPVVEKAMTSEEIAAMIGANDRQSFADWQAMYETQLAERDERIAQLEAQVQALEAKTSRPVVKETPANVQALPKLVAGENGRAECSVIGQDGKPHGMVAPNIRHQCPKCYSYAVFLNSPAGKAAAEKNAAPAAA